MKRSEGSANPALGLGSERDGANLARPARGPGSAAASDRGAILVIAPQPFYEDRGTPIAVRQVIEALRDLGYLVDVVTYPVGRALPLEGVRIFRSANPLGFRSVPIGFSARKLVLDATLVPASWWRARSNGYRAIHAVEEAAFPAVLFGRRYGTPVVYDMQSSLPEQLTRHAILGRPAAQALLRRAERWLLRRVDVVVTSTGLAQQVAQVAPEARVREWRFAGASGVPSPDEVRQLRRSLAIPDGVPVVVYSGTFAHYQGLPDLVAAMPAVVRAFPDVVFVLVGSEGLEGERLARLTAGLVRAGRVRLVDRQPREAVPAYLAMADVLVSPRAYGGNLPLKIFDYLAAGKPIVATDVPSHRAVLDVAYAELVDQSAPALARAIVGLLQDPARAARLAAEARAYAERKLDWLSFVRSVEEIYEDVTGLDAPAVAAPDPLTVGPLRAPGA